MSVGDKFRHTLATGAAKRLWKLFGLRTPDDLDLEDLAYALGIIVLEGKLDSADARLVRNKNRGLVRVNASIHQIGRKRFAVAHEIGHWELHETLSQILACTSQDMTANYKGSPPEIEANWFAAELLMPQQLFAPAIAGVVPSPDVVNGLAGDYRTTRTATAVRYVELSQDYCAVVISKNGRIKWWRASSQFDKQLWITNGAKVSPRTLAGRFFDGIPADIEVSPVSMAEWAHEYPDYAENAYEGVIPLGNTGAVLSMLWLE